MGDLAEDIVKALVQKMDEKKTDSLPLHATARVIYHFMPQVMKEFPFSEVLSDLEKRGIVSVIRGEVGIGLKYYKNIEAYRS